MLAERARLLHHLAVLAGALAIAGCSGVPPAGTTSPADRRGAAPSALATEREWLQSWFKGTPVRIAQPSDGAVTIDVPREHCFDAGRSSVKPALAAVLDKVAQSLHRLPQARVQLLAAPDDAGGASGLAAQRAAQIQKELVHRGVRAARLGPPSVTTVAAVQLHITLASP